MSRNDLTVRARLRDAAIELVAEEGRDALTARAVADRAGASPGSVMNNFGSMAGLRLACDDHVAGIIRDQKMRVMSAGGSPDILGALREAGAGPLLGYLAAVLSEDSPAVAHLVDELVVDAEAYIEAGVRSGMLRPSDDPRGRAVVLTLLSLGGLVLHRHLHRLLGVDVTAHDADPERVAAYAAPLYELYAGGLFTQSFARQARSAVAGLAAHRSRPTTQTPDQPDAPSDEEEPHE